jgi:hypothetical protein
MGQQAGSHEIAPSRNSIATGISLLRYLPVSFGGSCPGQSFSWTVEWACCFRTGPRCPPDVMPDTRTWMCLQLEAREVPRKCSLGSAPSPQQNTATIEAQRVLSLAAGWHVGTAKRGTTENPGTPKCTRLDRCLVPRAIQLYWICSHPVAAARPCRRDANPAPLSAND